MKTFYMDAKSPDDAIKQMQSFFGGQISERWGEYILEVDSDIGNGIIKFITFDWGVSVADLDMVFNEDILLVEMVEFFNPIHFSYCSKGYYQHRYSNEAEYNTIHKFHSVISTAKKGIDHHLFFKKNVRIRTNNIQIVRKEFQNKTSFTAVSMLNKKLYDTFRDHTNQTEFVYYAPINVLMNDHVEAIRNSDSKGIMRILQIEGEVYQLLSMHLEQYERVQNTNTEKQHPKLLNKEIKIIRRFASKIIEDPSINYSLEYLSYESGLSQPKLQLGFKFLYTRTVTDYVRHIRLEKARDLLNVTDLNVSQVVYKVGFSSRSYFSKIFKEKYGITPTDLRKNPNHKQTS